MSTELANIELSVVMPVYNEEGSIVNVVKKWMDELNRLNIRYVICVYNDGSRDKTGELLKENFADSNNVRIIDKKNSGHGPTILLGYKENLEYKWIFQIDSDDEISPEYFEKLWSERDNFDFLIGERTDRKQPLSRKLVSFISRLTVRLFYGNGVIDVNSPYRLMRSSALGEYILKMPDDIFAPNVIISGIVNKIKVKIFSYPVQYKFRLTGEVSIKKWKLLKASLKSFFQTVKFAFIPKIK